jgi:LCP family protein required for cell wall assembly
MLIKHRRSQRNFGKVLVLLTVIFCLGYGLYTVSRWYESFVKTTGLTVGTVLRLGFDDGAPLKSADGQTNILLLGIGGGTHDGPDLTDTMMVISFDWVRQNMTLISIPRDIWSDTLKDKVNSAYHYGEVKKKGGGLTLAQVTVEDVLGIPIEYSIVVDFAKFMKIIDLVGGIDVNVSQAFTDDQYPITGKENDTCNGDLTYACRYMTVHFDAGLQHMDGARTLIYVRSRHAEGTEGNDFARNRRQQEVMMALKQKLMQPAEFIHLKQDMTLFEAIDDASDMDLTVGELLTVGKIAARIKNTAIKKITIDDLFIQPPAAEYNGLFVLIPQDSWDIVHTAVKTRLTSGQ